MAHGKLVVIINPNFRWLNHHRQNPNSMNFAGEIQFLALHGHFPWQSVRLPEAIPTIVMLIPSP